MPPPTLNSEEPLMHLLALGAFRRKYMCDLAAQVEFHRLNAPFGARCFLTINFDALPDFKVARLNAPFGARCFLTHLATPTADCYPRPLRPRVLMHLLVLGAF